MAKNTNRGNRAETTGEALRRTTKDVGRWANSTAGRSILAGAAATIAGLLLSRDRRVRDAAAGATTKVREAANEASESIKAKIAERRGREVGDEPAEAFEVPTTGRTDSTAGVIAH